MIDITPDLVRAINPRHPRPDVAAPKIQRAFEQFGITTRNTVAMALGQIGHESGLIPQEENLSYRATRLMQVWPGRFPTLQSALPYQFNPEALGDKVYGGRMGNGPTEGFEFRGRGPIQLTGKSNYVTYGRLIGFDLVAQPDLLLQYGVGFLAAGAFWQAHGLNGPAERGDVRAVTRAINGGTIGLDDRERLYQRALSRVPRYGLLASDAALNVEADAAADLDARHEQVTRILGLL
ncbi:glycoside hydrolase family 19 protein [Deinococcus sp. 14RED07]|uniref:glycoside hydrolase family 19 protein n=1 Tax=unclassified Deinococcus TaxID=2623546 RepID=UPI001E4C1658|nr:MULTISPECIES: glycoside hydrolase family 19 protein [unclassified Deinococcus]MCD0164868.1 glycoside hydrolase family 19 protein [Deinococcus sp. 12RED42]MCD0174401.1 glycoside hydrolase family 19 protein [Deinococcus sp. 14RED07]